MATFGDLTGILLDTEIHSTDSTIRWTSTRRALFVNRGYEEFCELTECLTRQSTITLSCGTTEYNLMSSATMSTDFVRVAGQGIEYHLVSSQGGSSASTRTAANDDFPRRDIEWLNHYRPNWRESTTVVEFPEGYYLRADGGGYFIGLTERPDMGSSETGKLIVPYLARPVRMTASTDIPFTIGSTTRLDLIPFHNAFAHWAAHEIETLRGDPQASDRQLVKFMSYVERFRGKFRNKGGAFVRLARNYLREASQKRRNADSRGQDPRRWP